MMPLVLLLVLVSLLCGFKVKVLLLLLLVDRRRSRSAGRRRPGMPARCGVDRGDGNLKLGRDVGVVLRVARRSRCQRATTAAAAAA